MRALLCLLAILWAVPVSAQCQIGPATVPCAKPALRTVPVANATELNAKLAAALPGDKLVLASGVYYTPLTTSRHGTQAAPIVLAAAPGATVNIRPGYANSNSAVNLNHNWYILRGIEVSQGWHGVQVNGRYVVLEDLNVHDTGSAATASGQGILVMNSDVAVVRLTQARAGLWSPSPKFSHGLYISDYYNRGVSRVVLQDSVLRENGGAGLHVWNSSLKTRDLRVEGNTFEQNAVDAVFTNVERAVVSGNTFIQNGAPTTDYALRAWLLLELSTGLQFTGNRFSATLAAPTCTPIYLSSQLLKELKWVSNIWAWPVGCGTVTDELLNQLGGQ